MSILVTGAAGFIASHLIEKLHRNGEQVVGIDNFDPFYDVKIKQQNKTALGAIPFYEGDLCDSVLLAKVFSENDIDLVVHLAAKAGVRPSLQDPTAYARANVEATLSLLDMMNKHGVKKLSFASSSSVYGTTASVPFTEDAAFDSAISVYASTKQAGELFTRMYHNLYNFDVHNLRFFTVYGPRQRPDLAIHKFLKANLLGEEITVFGNGEMARDYTFVEDTVQGILGSINVLRTKKNVYETYNLGNSTPVTLKELLDTIEKVAGKECRKKSAPVPDGDVPVTFADISKAKRDLGYNPKTNLETGLGVMWQWIQSIYT